MMIPMSISEDQLERLRSEANDLPSKVSRPLFVEFAGTPKSGKSTCIDAVNHFLRRSGFKVLAPTEGASRRTPYYLKDDLLSYNTWSAIYALTHILEGRFSTDQYHIALLDRGLFDALGWFELLKEDGNDELTEGACAIIQDFLLLDHWRNFIDIVFLFVTDPKTSLQRENQDKLIEEPGRAMNPEFLERLNNAYQNAKDKHSNKFNRFVTVDTGSEQNTNPKSTAFEVAQEILKLMRERGPS